MPSDKNESTKISIQELLEDFSSGSLRKRRGLIKTVESRADEISTLGSDALKSFDPDGDDWSAGWILQVLSRKKLLEVSKLLPQESSGWFTTHSKIGIDYGPLQAHLLAEEFEQADRFTSAALRQLAGPQAESRGYVYFSEVESIAGIDLLTIDRLWQAYSQGKFGFSVQSRLLNSLDGRYDRLWPRIGWKIDGVWTRYPKSFTWSLEAPEGHMPLVNQLRGVRLMHAILNHPELEERFHGHR